jgi:hypothetical protein
MQIFSRENTNRKRWLTEFCRNTKVPMATGAHIPQGSPQKRPMVVTSKPANGMWPGTRLFYSDAS